MTVSKQPKLRLKVTETAFVTSVAEAERGPPVRTLVVSREIFRRAVSFAESSGWPNPDRSHNLRHLPRPAVLTFAKALRDALETEPTGESNTKARMSTKTQLAQYFSVAAHRRQLDKVLDFLQAGGELNIEDA